MRQIGNAVPVWFAEKIGTELAKKTKRNINHRRELRTAVVEFDVETV